LITKDTQQAYALESSLKFFSKDTLSPEEILVFPDWETLPYDTFSPHEDIISQRLDTLNRLPHVKKGILILPITTLLHRLPPTSFIQGNSLSLKIGQNFNTQIYKKSLESVGYRNVATVY
jgi:transcription-repair coupling factor (superfamily II helicase)